MPEQHEVQLGECISSIAFQYGFFPDTIWDHPSNSQLRSEREDPNVLAPGDVVNVPDKRPKEYTRSTGERHRFQKKNVPAMLNLTILDDGVARAFEPFEAIIDGEVVKGATDGDGAISIPISPLAKRAKITVGDGDDKLVYELRLGHLPPIDRVEGVQARLENLSYPCGDEQGEVGPATLASMHSFQADHGLPQSDEIDDALRNKLVELHGS